MPHELDDRPAHAPEPQWRRPLTRASHVRQVRAAWKRRLAREPNASQARRLLVELLSDPPEDLHGMQIGELLEAGKGVGSRSRDRYLAAIPVSCTRLVGELTERQRRTLIDALCARERSGRA